MWVSLGTLGRLVVGMIQEPLISFSLNVRYALKYVGAMIGAWEQFRKRIPSITNNVKGNDSNITRV